MPDINPIVQTLLQLIEAKHNDAQLAQRQKEAADQLAFNQEQFKATLEERKLERKRQEVEDLIQHAQLQQAATRQFRGDVASGLVPVQGYKGLPPSVPDWQTQLGRGQTRVVQLPNGQSIEVPMPQMDTSVSLPEQSNIPNNVQTTEGPVGPISIPTNQMLTYEDAQKRMDAEALRKTKWDVLTKGLEAQATEAARVPRDTAANQARIDTANITATGANTRNTATINSNQQIATDRNKTAITVANINKSAKVTLDTDTVNDMSNSVALGETKLPSGNTGFAVNTALKDQGLVVPDVATAKKVPFAQTMLNLADRIESKIIPQLATTPGTAWVKGVLTNQTAFPTELYNEYKAMGIDATTSARDAGEKGNFSNSDIGRAWDALTSPGITQTQATERLGILRSKIYNKLLNEHLGGLPDKQKIMMLQKYNFEPSSIPALDSKGSPIIINNKILPKFVFGQKSGTWGVYNPQKKAYEGVDHE